jgi:hypothetical protein
MYTRQRQNVTAKKQFKFKYISIESNNNNSKNNNHGSNDDGIHNGNTDNNMFQQQSFWSKDVNIPTNNISC